MLPALLRWTASTGARKTKPAVSALSFMCHDVSCRTQCTGHSATAGERQSQISLRAVVDDGTGR